MLEISAKLGEEFYHIGYKSFLFYGGEVQVRLIPPQYLKKTPDRLNITSYISSSNDLMELLLAVNAIRHMYSDIPIFLTIPYLPYARQDRICYLGESKALEVLGACLNTADVSSVTVWDVHSEAGLKTLHSYVPTITIAASHFFSDPDAFPTLDWRNTIIVAPDKGARDRAIGVAAQISSPFVQAEKIRDPNDGSITGMEVYCGDMGKQDFLIVDDICDGGRTFIELAKILKTKTKGKIKLYVTHGIFSQGFKVFDGLIDEIYVANLFYREDVPDNVSYIQMMGKKL